MKKLGAVAVVLAMMMLISAPVLAQEAAKPEAKPEVVKAALNWYKLEFRVSEFDNGKKLNTREFTIEANTSRPASVRVGSRVPVSGEKGIQYFETGLGFDYIQMSETPDGPQIVLRGDLSGATTEQGSGGNPIIRTMRFDSAGLVIPGKPTLLVSMDDANSTRRFQIEVTATKVLKQ